MIFQLFTTAILLCVEKPTFVTSSLFKKTQYRPRPSDIKLDQTITTSSKLKEEQKRNIVSAPRLLEEMTLSRDNLIETIENSPDYWILTFKLYPIGKINDYASILRYTSTDNNKWKYGDRWLAIWFHPKSYNNLHIVAGSTTDTNDSINIYGAVKENTENEIKIEAIGDKISFYVNGVLRGSLPNTNRPVVPELKVYAADKFYYAANAKIIDLTFTPIESPDKACLPKDSFELHANGCSYDKLITSIQQKLSYGDPIKDELTPCYHSASKELEYHLPANTTDAEGFIKDVCAQAHKNYENDNAVPWSEVTLEGDKFDKEYYDGNGDWNEEHQTNYPHPMIVPGQPSNVLKRDAERVDDLYETHLQRNPLQWPGDSPTSMSNFANCELQAAMCCWVSDRQANDNNGNCATPYDTRCLDADPGDNTDLCAVDIARSVKDSVHVNDGFAIFSDAEEGPVHCHGLAWGEDETEADFRYRANNLFYVSMSDHLHDRGYVRSVQGSPMCGCVEHMPIVSRSDCTEITAKEFYKFTFPENYSGEIAASVEYVDIDFNACRASQNNNLQRFYERLLNEGRVSRAKYDKFRNTVVGDYQCPNAIEDLLFDKGYQHEAPALEGWTILYGRGSMISSNSQPELWKNIDKGSYIRRICRSCSRDSHKDIIYKRLTSKGEIDFKDLLLSNWYSDPSGDGKNIRSTDFNLFSSFQDAKDNKNPWKYCNYNYGGVGFPRDCGPTTRVTQEWNSMSKGGESDFAFYLYTGDGNASSE